MRSITILSSVLLGVASASAPAHADAPARLPGPPSMSVVWGDLSSPPVANGASVEFGRVEVGRPDGRGISIGNGPNSQALQVQYVTLTGDADIAWQSGPEIFPPTFPLTVPSNSSRTVAALMCLATIAGDHEASVTIISNDLATPVFTLNVRCHVDAALVPGPPSMSVVWGDSSSPPLVSGALVDFGRVVVGTPAGRGISIGNGPNSEPLHVQSVTLTGDPEIAWQSGPVYMHPTFPLTVPSNFAENVVLMCMATTVGAHEATVTIASDDTDYSTFVLRVVCDVEARSGVGSSGGGSLPAADLPESGSPADQTALLAGLALMVGLALRRLVRRPTTPA
jgi:hypothetical protein